MPAWDLSQMRMTLALCASLTASTIAVSVAAQTGALSSVSHYWPKALDAQGAPPTHWSEAEKSLSPDACRQCHAEQFTQWQTSRHAHALSSGVLGQLLTFDAADTAQCLGCHAPLDEQRTAFEAARTQALAHRRDRLGLAAAGNTCAGCHLRANRRFGPPQRNTGAVEQSATQAVHDGVTRVKFFESPEFCARCHQFTADRAINGKPLENTLVEWQASPQAAQGATCQTCHMPDRHHLWRGIHDPDMVRAGLTIATSVDAQAAHFEIVNSGVGHAFPTYMTPKVVMHAVVLDAKGQPQAQTARQHVIGRRVRYDKETDRWSELSDTRLLPQQSVALELPWAGRDRVRVWLEVAPDDYYATVVFPDLLRDLPASGEARQLIVKAAGDAAVSNYVLFEVELHRP